MEQSTALTAEDQELYKAYFNKDADYYLKRLERINNGEKYTINPFALFFGLEMLIIEAFQIDTSSFDHFINLIVALLIDGLGNYFYMKNATKAVLKAQEIFADQEDRLIYLNKEGGTNIVLTAIIAIVLLAIMGLVIFSPEYYYE